MSAEPVYLDSSAIIKLVTEESESGDLIHYLAERSWRISCGLAWVEVIRSVRRQGPAAVARAQDVLSRIDLVRLDDELLVEAAQLDPLVLRSLDAIHLAAAKKLGSTRTRLVTYDQRLADAARQLGLIVDSPGA